MNTHTPCVFGIYLVSSFQSHKYEPIIYRGADCIDVFYNELVKLSDKVRKVLSNEKQMVITKQQTQ